MLNSIRPIIAIALLWLSYTALPSFAACGTFTESTIKSSLTEPYGLSAGDYDNDGDIDIAVAERTADKITWYENNGSQVFSTAHSVKTSYTDALLVRTFDVNEDGFPDLVATQDETSVGDTEDLIVFLNNGDGSVWTEKTAVSTSDGAKQFDIMDINNGTGLDIVLADSNNDDVEWYKNNGSETFSLNTVVSSLDGVIGAALGDINKDGEVDIVVATQGTSQDIIWYENDGSENFSANAHTIDSTYSGQYLELVDLDQDGDLDVVVASYANDLLSWYSNDGDETFTDMGNIASGTDLDQANHPHVGDLDNDGDLDIVLGAWAADKFMWFENDGSESFTKTVLKTSTDARESFLVDLDGDGYTDIIQADKSGGAIIWYKSDCTDASPVLFFVP
ncbi:MAG: VCBS repeat-containing protein [Candidatus Melainabacteria bacterium]|nr:VCBS repeat-containing protein [Candidatus Melainabacteria bacterium]